MRGIRGSRASRTEALSALDPGSAEDMAGLGDYGQDDFACVIERLTTGGRQRLESR